jgi:hypothetical protein
MGAFLYCVIWRFVASYHDLLCQPVLMQQPVKERIAKLREEIAQISEANRLYLQGGKKVPGSSSAHERRLERLREIQHELMALTDLKKP